MGGGGSISAMLALLRSNNRRGNRAQFEKKLGFDIEKTKYDFPVVSNKKREEVVKRLLKKRRLSEFLHLGVFVLFIGFLLFFAIAVIYVLLNSMSN